MPVFGAIKPPPPSSSSSISSSLLLLLLAGGVGAAALLRGKTSNAASKDDSKADKRTGEPVIIPSPERQQPRVARETPHLPSTACPDLPPIVLDERKEKKEEKESTKPSTTKQPNGSFKSNSIKIETEVKEQNPINNDKSKEEKTILKTSDHAPLPKIALNGGDTEMKRVTKSEETSKTIPEIIVSQEVSNIANKVEPAKIIPTEQARTPSQTKTKFEDLPINITTVDEVEEVDYITKIKTFKITRWSKTRAVESKSLKVGKSLKIGRKKSEKIGQSEKSDLI